MRYCLILILAFTIGCNEPSGIQLVEDHDGLMIEIEVVPEMQKFGTNQFVLMGKLKISNTTKSPQPFGTSFLYLQIDDQAEARTYKQTIASEVVDFGVVQIAPNEVMSFKAYWVYENRISSDTTSLSMRFDIDELARRSFVPPFLKAKRE